MIFDKDKNYKLHAMNDALVITESTTQVKAGQPLILADSGRLLIYLDRFFFEREHGKSLKDAHELAMRTAQIHEIKVPS